MKKFPLLLSSLVLLFSASACNQEKPEYHYVHLNTAYCPDKTKHDYQISKYEFKNGGVELVFFGSVLPYKNFFTDGFILFHDKDYCPVCSDLITRFNK